MRPIGTTAIQGRPTTRLVMRVLAVAGLVLAAGCEKRAEKFGKTFYLDGAGNWGFGALEVPAGLQKAGYQGDVEVYVWSTSFLPLIDQINRVAAHLQAARLADRIKAYRRAYPDTPLNIIALSAGTGVATWAVEALDDDDMIDNLIFLGSSLSADYDMTAALSHIRGRLYCYHSPHDQILSGIVPVVGTIDGKIATDAVGLVGLTQRSEYGDRVINVGWSREWLSLGWAGGHTDCTNERFVHGELARHVVGTGVYEPHDAEQTVSMHANAEPEDGDDASDGEGDDA